MGMDADHVGMGWGMKRWLAMVENGLAGFAATILALAALAGCQPTFMTKDMYETAHIPMLKDYEQNHNPIGTPLSNLTTGASDGANRRSAATLYDAARGDCRRPRERPRQRAGRPTGKGR